MALIPYKTTSADTYSYARVIKEVGFYKTTSDEKPLFYLPYSYYVKVLEEGAVFSKIECFGENSLSPSLEGFALTDDLVKETSLEVFSPYLSFTIETASYTPLYQDINFDKISQYLFENRTLNYYGYNKVNGGYVYFVEYNGKLGFVREESIKPFTLPLHENPIDVPVVTPPNEEVQNENDNSNSLSVIILVLTLVLTVAVIIYIFVPKKPKLNTGYYDENDFE
ncbi:MAG: hypothetical protein E7342_00215 [Clostridiales bacterium]|nr:hypothetical protein [Clostridiales bacterium]